MKNTYTKIVSFFSYTNFSWNLTKMSSFLMFLHVTYIEVFMWHVVIIIIPASKLILFLIGGIASRKSYIFY